MEFLEYHGFWRNAVDMQTLDECTLEYTKNRSFVGQSRLDFAACFTHLLQLNFSPGKEWKVDNINKQQRNTIETVTLVMEKQRNAVEFNMCVMVGSLL